MPRPIRIISNDSGMPITVLAETKGKRYTKDNHPYCMYMDCTKCKNASWYDDDYCNNQHLHFRDKANVHTTKVYCENYEVENAREV